MKHFSEDQGNDPRNDLPGTTPLRPTRQRRPPEDRRIMLGLMAALVLLAGVIWLLIGWILP